MIDLIQSMGLKITGCLSAGCLFAGCLSAGCYTFKTQLVCQ
jgi:hypothetical protein